MRAEDVVLDERGRAAYTLVCPQGTARVSLRQSGAHHVGNSLAVAAAALELGLSLDQVVAGLSRRRGREPLADGDHRPPRRRASSSTTPTTRTPTPCVPRSTPSPRCTSTGERWAVLGGMLELGPDSDAEHAAVGAYAASLGFDHVVAVGEGARPLADAVPGSQWVPDTDAAHDLLATRLRAGRRRPAQVEPRQRAALARRPARGRGRRCRHRRHHTGEVVAP